MKLLNWLFKFLLSMTVALVQTPSMGQTNNLFLVCETITTTTNKYSHKEKPLVKRSSQSAMIDITTGAIIEGTIFGGLHTKNGFNSKTYATNFSGNLREPEDKSRIYKPHEIVYGWGTYSLDRITGEFSAKISFDQLDSNGKIHINGNYEMEEKGKCSKAENRLY
jgi:hypothetical protein